MALASIVNRASVAPMDGGEPTAWLASPWLDLFFIANIFWPLLLLPALRVGETTAVSFWQVYFVTLPHRWLTLALVALDPDRRAGSPVWIGMALLLPALLLFVVWSAAGSLICLAMIDFVWNAWHFGSQHAGISRAYSIRCGDGHSSFERWGIRLLVVYALARPVEWITGWVSMDSNLGMVLSGTDWVVMSVGMTLLAANLIKMRQPGRAAKLCHLASLVILYSCLVAAVHWGWTHALVPLLTASALMHASEYIAFVGVYINKRSDRGGEGPVRAVASHLLGWLMTFITVMGCIGWLMELSPSSAATWGALNLWAAFVHYGLDGFIWKLRQPSIRAVLSTPRTLQG